MKILKLISVFTGLVLGGSVLGSVGVVEAAQNSNLIISEINYAGSAVEGNCKQDLAASNRCSYEKWVELSNISDKNIVISGYTIRFGSMDATGDIFKLSGNIQSGKSIVIAYTEVGFAPVFSSPNFTSGKVLRVSNNTSGAISVGLFDDKGSSQDIVNLTTDTFGSKDDMRGKSIEFNGSSWSVSSNQFAPNNFGTPGSSILPIVPTIVEVITPVVADPILAAPAIVPTQVKVASPAPIAQEPAPQVITEPVTPSVTAKLPEIIVSNSKSVTPEKTLIDLNQQNTSNLAPTNQVAANSLSSVELNNHNILAAKSPTSNLHPPILTAKSTIKQNTFSNVTTLLNQNNYNQEATLDVQEESKLITTEKASTSTEVLLITSNQPQLNLNKASAIIGNNIKLAISQTIKTNLATMTARDKLIFLNKSAIFDNTSQLGMMSLLLSIAYLLKSRNEFTNILQNSYQSIIRVSNL